jgi:pilus assembly protein Flp/PilA
MSIELIVSRATKKLLPGVVIERFAREESGATIVEYAILIAAVAMAVVITVAVLGQKLDSSFQKMVTLMS